MMNVGLTNEGPVTFTLDSRKCEYVKPASSEKSQSGASAKVPLPPSFTPVATSSAARTHGEGSPHSSLPPHYNNTESPTRGRMSIPEAKVV